MCCFANELCRNVNQAAWRVRSAWCHVVLLCRGWPRPRGSQGMTDENVSPLLLDGYRSLLPFVYLLLLECSHGTSVAGEVELPGHQWWVICFLFSNQQRGRCVLPPTEPHSCLTHSSHVNMKQHPLGLWVLRGRVEHAQTYTTYHIAGCRPAHTDIRAPSAGRQGQKHTAMTARGNCKRR